MESQVRVRLGELLPKVQEIAGRDEFGGNLSSALRYVVRRGLLAIGQADGIMPQIVAVPKATLDAIMPPGGPVNRQVNDTVPVVLEPGEMVLTREEVAPRREHVIVDLKCKLCGATQAAVNRGVRCIEAQR